MKRRIVMPPEIISTRPLRAHRVERTLTLHMKAIYFDQIKAGTKVEEFRLCTPYWGKRLLERSYDSIVLTKGYPAAEDSEHRMVLPWRGYAIKVLQHPHFGDEAVSVFAIRVSSSLPSTGGNSNSLPQGSTALHRRESS